MTRAMLFLILFGVVLGRTTPGHGESLDQVSMIASEIDTDSWGFGPGRIQALCLGGDTVVLASYSGIWVHVSHNQPWRKLMDGPIVIGNDSIYYDPIDILQTPAGEVVILINGKLIKLNMRDGDSTFTEVWRYPNDYGERFDHLSVADGFLVCGRYCWSEDPMLVALQPIDNERGGELRKIFPIPADVKEWLRSVYIYSPHSMTACDRKNNIIWVLIYGYEQIYVIDMRGEILDSVHIARSDYIDPGPPKSWMRTQAVFQDWLSNWTPIWEFAYIDPDYFMLQYEIGSEAFGDDTVRLYGTAVWDSDRQSVDLELDPHWQLAGVQPDGRVIFAHYDIENGKRRIVLNIVRIVP